ncbi:MAG: fibronectin type III domain-containing protein [Balneolales bacterium]|nr:fibronectin type III domain-containing protein [Balneolales bacterium]
MIPLSQGYHVSRSIAGGPWQQLTESPVLPVQSGPRLQQELGRRFDLLRDFSDRNDPQSIFLRLRSPSTESLLLAFSMPDLALAMGYLFVDDDAPLGQRVQYRFELTDDLGRPTGVSFSGEAVLEPVTPPAPTRVTASNQNRMITLNWQYPRPGSAGTEHVIYFMPRFSRVGSDRVITPDQQFQLRTTSTTFRQTFQVPQTGSEYEFWVEAIDYSGRSSLPSERVRIRVADNVPPPPVTSVSGRATSRFHSEISWPVSTAIDVAGYHVYRSTAQDTVFTRITTDLIPPLATSFVDTETIPGTQYRYQVRVLDTLGNESGPSNSAHVLIVDYVRPPAPVGLSSAFDRGTEQIVLNWEAGSPETNLRSYRILRRQVNPPSGRAFTQLNESAYLDISFRDKGISTLGFEEGVTYEYAVLAISASGNISDTTKTRVQVPVLTAPEPPGSVRAQAGNHNRISVSWSPSSSQSVTSYNVYRKQAGTENLQLLRSANRGNRFYRDEELPADVQFRYAVTAVDSVGNESPALLSDMVQVRRSAPPVPAFNVQAVVNAEAGAVVITWQSREENEMLGGFRIYRSTIATGTYELVGEASSAERRFADEGAGPGGWYRVFPVDHTGRKARQARAVQAVIRTR